MMTRFVLFRETQVSHEPQARAHAPRGGRERAVASLHLRADGHFVDVYLFSITTMERYTPQGCCRHRQSEARGRGGGWNGMPKKEGFLLALANSSRGALGGAPVALFFRWGRVGPGPLRRNQKDTFARVEAYFPPPISFHLPNSTRRGVRFEPGCCRLARLFLVSDLLLPSTVASPSDI